MTTFKAAKTHLAAMGISLSKSEGEYRVAFKGTRRDDTYSEAYFTDCLKDAVLTGERMAQKPTLAAAVEYHSVASISVSDATDYTGKGMIRIGGVGTFTAKANAYGNWYGYQGKKRTEMFWGDYTDQMFEAAAWLKRIEQAAALKSL